jgi:hypothetical protein
MMLIVLWSKYILRVGNPGNRSAELQLICSDRDLGPRLQDSTACSHRLEWRTPAACPQVYSISGLFLGPRLQDSYRLLPPTGVAHACCLSSGI